MANDPRGSVWRRWDLHFHTPASFDYGNMGLTAAEVVDRLLKADIAAVVVTDHHKLDAAFVSAMRDAAKGKLTVLPGMEISSNLGGSDGVHFIAIFSEDSDLEHLSTELTAKLELGTKRKGGIAEDSLYVDFPAAAEVIQTLNGLISVHGHKKHASLEGISNHLKFKQQQKTDLLRNVVDLIELSDRTQASQYTDIVFPHIQKVLPLVVASDDHAREPFPVHKYCWIKADPTFAGLRMALREPGTRFCLDDIPPSVSRIERNKTRYIKSVTFSRLGTMPRGENWLQGEVPLNTGLVAIIGNKGSGKSAFADCLGLLGSCGTSSSFSFLQAGRFCNPKTGRAAHVQATLHWHDGAPVMRVLSDSIGTDEPERVKYLPQSFVETVCNDLGTPGGGEFERELKKVVFSKVSKPDRLAQRSLDDLVQFRTQEIRRDAESLATNLTTLAEQRSQLEDRLDPAVRTSLEKLREQIKEQIQVHQATKPVEVKPPTEDAAITEQSRKDVQALEELRTQRELLATQIKTAEQTVANQQLRAAQANKLLDKLKNVELEVDRRKADFKSDAIALGIDPEVLLTLNVDRAPAEKVRDEAIYARDSAQTGLDRPLPVGLRAQLVDVDAKIKLAQEQLSRPNQEFQKYVDALSKWNSARDKLTGTANEPRSLEGVNADIVALEGIPAHIAEVDRQLEDIAKHIHEARLAEAAVYSELYGPIQQFVSDHPLAKSQLQIEFRVELTEEGFVDTLLSHLNQGRIGSFSGTEEGRKHAGSLTAPVPWSTWNNVLDFLKTVVEDLHIDKRSGYGKQPVLLKNQIGKGRSAAELYSWLYGLSFLKPRYILKLDGKRLEQLSPGERGTLLLVFYLLVDDSDVPLIVDQPEANLDNSTVAQKLVACIRDARDRRQVIIVTHNPNLAVVCDADQVIHAKMDISAGNRISYTAGGLENPAINKLAIEVLEGGRPPFDMRDETYWVCEDK